MRVLIAIMSCARDMENGANQAIRDTWLKDVPPGWDAKFFIGEGQPLPLEQESELYQAHHKHFSSIRIMSMQPPQPINRALLQGDEVILPVYDGYPYLVYKVREMRRWASQHHYDYIFKVDSDTFVWPQKLRTCGFEKHDYIGACFDLEGGEGKIISDAGLGKGQYAQGGPGYWLSKKAYEKTCWAPIYTFCEDVWTGLALHLEGIRPDYDGRYRWGNNIEGAIALVNTMPGTNLGSWMKMLKDRPERKTTRP